LRAGGFCPSSGAAEIIFAVLPVPLFSARSSAVAASAHQVMLTTLTSCFHAGRMVKRAGIFARRH